MTDTDIVKKLIGSIHPIGDTHIDKERLENLKRICELTTNLLIEISKVESNRYRKEHSIKEIGEYAHNYLSILDY